MCQVSYFWKVVWWNESEAIDANLMYAVDGLQHATHPLITLSTTQLLVMQHTHTQTILMAFKQVNVGQRLYSYFFSAYFDR